jgi:hypothetical protein
MDDHNVPEAEPHPAPGPDVPATSVPERKRDVPPDSQPKTPGRPAAPEPPQPVPAPPVERGAIA